MKNKRFLQIALVLVMVFSFSMVYAAGLEVTFVRTFGGADSVERARDVTIAFDSSFLADGESLTAAMVALTTIYSVTCEMSLGYVPRYDYTNVDLELWYGDYSNGSDGELVIVPGTTDVSAVSAMRCRITGK